MNNYLKNNALDFAADAVFVFDKNKKLIFINKTCLRLMGINSNSKDIPKCCNELFQCKPRKDIQDFCPGDRVLKGKEETKRIWDITVDGKKKIVEARYAPVPNENNEVEFVIGIIRDVTTIIKSKENSKTRPKYKSFLEDNIDFIKSKYGISNMVGVSNSIINIFEQIKLCSMNNASVLIEGESGTGKEVVAKAIHEIGIWSMGPFNALNCSALPETLFESELFGYKKGAFTGANFNKDGIFINSDNGTLFLDEITEIPISSQAKLLRVIQENKVRPLGSNKEINLNLRIISASNRDIDKAIKAGELRKDLFYRISVMRIQLPPLRERRDDIKVLSYYFLDQYNNKSDLKISGFDQKALEVLENYNWPGNVRELQNIVERAFIISGSGIITLDALPDYIIYPNVEISEQNTVRKYEDRFNLAEILEEYEKDIIEKALIETKGNKSKASKLLGISRNKLYKKIDKLGL